MSPYCSLVNEAYNYGYHSVVIYDNYNLKEVNSVGKHINTDTHIKTKEI